MLTPLAASFSTNRLCILRPGLLRGAVCCRSSEQPLRECHFINAVLALPILRRRLSFMMHCEKIGTNISGGRFQRFLKLPVPPAEAWDMGLQAGSEGPSSRSRSECFCFLSFQKGGRCLRLFCMHKTMYGTRRPKAVNGTRAGLSPEPGTCSGALSGHRWPWKSPSTSSPILFFPTYFTARSPRPLFSLFTES